MAAQTLSPQDAALAQALAALVPPGFTPPSLLNPNYVPPDRGPLVIAVTITFTVVAVITVALRLFLRIFHRDQKFKWDDYLIIPAIIGSIAQTVLTILLVKLGGEGKHVYDVDVVQFEFLVRASFASAHVFQFTTMFVKLSLVVFVRRLYTPEVSVIANRAFLLYIIFYAGFFISSTVAPFLLCTPLAASWDLRVLVLQHGQCPHRTAAYTTFNIIFAVSDVILLFLAIYKIWFLRLPSQTKAGIIFLLSLGGLSCICSIWRAVYFVAAANTVDETWNLSIISMLLVIEVNITSITASLPACSVLFRKMIPKSLRSNSLVRAPVDKAGEQSSDREEPDKVMTREIRGSYIRESC